MDKETAMLKQRLREDSVARIQQIFLTHFVVMLFFKCIQLFGYEAILPVAFVSFCNTICLAERCWAVQRQTLGCWSAAIQIVFIVTRGVVVLFLCLVFAALVYFACRH